MTDTINTPKPIPTPANFPVVWDHPDEASLYWVHDRMHWPTPVTPLTGQYIDIFLFSFNPVFCAWEMPVRMRSRRINTYHYHAVAPLALNEAEMAGQSQRTEAKMQAALESLETQWTDSYLPEIQQGLQYWADFDLAEATPPDLLAHLDETIARLKRLSEIHHIVHRLANLAPSLFQDFYEDLFDGEADSSTSGPADTSTTWAAYRLLQGFDNKTLAGDRALWRLSRQAQGAVRQALQEPTSPQVMATLEGSAAGRAFLADLRLYLNTYGWRSPKILELDAPTWREDPSPVISMLREYLSQPDRDPEAELASQAARREQLVAEARHRLAGYPQPVVKQFDYLLKTAQTGIFLSEEHGYWIDQGMTYHVRQVMLEFGRRLVAAGRLDTVDDVFYLTFDEVRAALAAPLSLDQRRLVAGRRAEMEQFRPIQPPPALGALPPGPPPDDPFSRAGARFWGLPPSLSAEPNVVRGNAGAPGTARGPARVVHSLAEAHKLQKGDVLVAEATMPPWTPLFALAGAIVTDTGGVLSHSAVVAREYGLPAVVGTGIATKTIQDGQMVEVDGSAGLVRIVCPE